MTTLLSAERYKLLHSKVTAVILLGIAAMKMFFIWAPYLFLPPAAPPTASGVSTTDGVNALFGQNGVRLMGGESTILLIWFMAFVGFFVAAEFQNGTMRNILSLGKRRTTVFISKLLMSFAALAAIFVITVVVAVVGRSLQYGFGDMGISEFIRYFTWNFFLQLLYHLPYAAVFCAIAFISRTPGMSIIISVGYLIFNSIAGSFLGNIAPLASRFLPEYYIGNFGKQIGDVSFVVSGVLVSIAYIAIAGIVGCVAFKKYDIK